MTSLEDRLAKIFQSSKGKILSSKDLLDALGILGKKIRIARLVYNLRVFRGMKIETVEGGYQYTSKEQRQLSLLEENESSQITQEDKT